MKRCFHCGAANHDKSKQCWSCKTPLDDENTNTSMGRLNQPRNKRKTKGLDTIIVVLIAFVLFLGLGYFTTLTNNTNINSASAITVDTSNLSKILIEAKGMKTDGCTPASIDTLNNAIKKPSQ
jgi:uncharacterized membrane protein YvbJ